MKSYLDCWVKAAAGLLPQALAGAPAFAESPPRPLGEDAFGFAATLAGGRQGRFAVFVDASILETPLLGEGLDQKAAWGELLRETAEAACGELLAVSGVACKVESFGEAALEDQELRAFELRGSDRSWTILVRDGVRAPGAKGAAAKSAEHSDASADSPAPGLRPGLELLLDVELEASLRFGSREMPLGEILDLGPGDVVQLDRHVTDPVDLIVADKIVARGEVVLVNGNFGLRVTEVAAPKKRLESIRCLF